MAVEPGNLCLFCMDNIQTTRKLSFYHFQFIFLLWTLSSSLAITESFESQKIATIARNGEQDISSQEDSTETLQSTEAPSEITTSTEDENLQQDQEENVVNDSEDKIVAENTAEVKKEEITIDTDENDKTNEIQDTKDNSYDDEDYYYDDNYYYDDEDTFLEIPQTDILDPSSRVGLEEVIEIEPEDFDLTSLNSDERVVRETDITQLRRKGRGKQRKARQFNTQPQPSSDRQQFAQQQQAFVQRQQQLVQQQQQALLSQQQQQQLFQQQQPQATSQVAQFANLGGQTSPINERFQTPGFLTRFQQNTQTQFGQQQQPGSQFTQAPQFNAQPFSNAQLQQFALQQQLLQQQQQAGGGQFVQPQPQQFGQQQPVGQVGQQNRFVSFGQINGQESVPLTTPRTQTQFATFPATPQASFTQAGVVGGTPQPNFQSFPSSHAQNDIQVRPVGQPGAQQGFSIQDLSFQGFNFDGSNSPTDNRQQQQFFQQETSPRRPSNARPPPNADPRQKDQALAHLNAPSSSDPISSFAQV